MRRWRSRSARVENSGRRRRESGQVSARPSPTEFGALHRVAEVICAEAGKPIATAQAEVARAIWTFALAAGVAIEDQGTLVPGDLDDAHRGYLGLARQVPSGVVVGISPFGFPLNLAAHKVAPALAIGAPIILKPPPQAPSAALILAENRACGGRPTRRAPGRRLQQRAGRAPGGRSPRGGRVVHGSARSAGGSRTRVPRARVVLEPAATRPR